MRARWCMPGVALALLSFARAAGAAWPDDPAHNLPLCTAPLPQQSPAMVADASRGALVAWMDLREGRDWDVFAMHILGSGEPDPVWPPDGLPVCTVYGSQFYPACTSDGAEGVIVAWQDHRDGAEAPVIVAQHVTIHGEVDRLWRPLGVPMSLTPGRRFAPSIMGDGAGGAFVSWVDASGPVPELAVQHLLAIGITDPAWPADGRCVSCAPDTGGAAGASMVTDGTGGAIVAWRRPSDGAVRVQHVLSSGSVDPQWPPGGVATNAGATLPAGGGPVLMPDLAGGAFVAWTEDGGDLQPSRLIAQHVASDGQTGPGWPAGGLAVAVGPGSPLHPVMAEDGAGGALLAWESVRGDVAGIESQHVLASGAIDPSWPAEGRTMCGVARRPDGPSIVADGSGGAIVTWTERAIDTNVRAGHVRAGGTLDAAWPIDGVLLSTAPADQHGPVMVSDGNGGAIVSWEDTRNVDPDLYAQRVQADGALGGDAVGVPGPAAGAPSILSVIPNPIRGAAADVRFIFTAPGPAAVELLDLEGRCRAAIPLVIGRAGTHVERLHLDAALAPGIYWVRVRQGGRSAAARVAVLE